MPKGIYKHRPQSEESKDKIRKALIGIPRPLDVRRKISLTSKGQKPWNTGKKRPPFSSEHRRKISIALIGKSPANKGKPMLSIRGERHWNWKGGKLKHLDKVIRQSLEYRLWRDSVFKRDNWTCVWCGARTKIGERVILNADHIKPFALYPALRFAIDNGRTLCVSCHRKTDTFGRKGHFYKNMVQ